MEYNWVIHDLESIISDGMVTRVVYGCEANYSGSSDSFIGSINITTGSSSDSSFINYENLTQDIVLGWVTGSIDQSTIQSNLSASIADYIVELAAVTSSIGKPWE